MIAARHALRRLSLGALLAALVLAGLAVAPTAAQGRRAVSAQRGQQLVWRYRQYGAEKVRIAGQYRAFKSWCERNWRLSNTSRYRYYRGQMNSLKIRYNWVKHYMNQIQAEYYGRNHGYIAAGGMNTNRRRTSNSGGLLNQRPNPVVRSANRTTRTTRTTRSNRTSRGTPNYDGLNLLNQRATRVAGRR